MGERRRRPEPGDAVTDPAPKRPRRRVIQADSVADAIDQLWRHILRDAVLEVAQVRQRQHGGNPDPGPLMGQVHRAVDQRWPSAARRAEQFWDLYGPPERRAAVEELYRIALHAAVASVVATLELSIYAASAHEHGEDASDDPKPNIPEAG